MRPYFEHDGVTLYHASCMDLMASMAPRSVGCTISDPPYTDRVHDGARSNRRAKVHGDPARPIDFPSVTDDVLRAAFVAMGRVTRRWVIATTAFEHAARMYDDPPEGLRPIRVGAWVKTDPMPQITGDRPTQGWEAISIQYADTCRPHWNGGGRPATHVGPTCDRHEAEYPTQKPEWLIARLIADFCDPGESIFDPFAGGGTTLVCAWKARHPVIGCDIREEACEVAARRLERVMSQGRLDLPARVKAVQSGLAF